jgi:hypothetical protein
VGIYGPRPIKRLRRTTNEIALLDEAIIRAVAEDKPVTLRGVFYRAMSAGAVPKTELGYRAVGDAWSSCVASVECRTGTSLTARDG